MSFADFKKLKLATVESLTGFAAFKKKKVPEAEPIQLGEYLREKAPPREPLPKIPLGYRSEETIPGVYASKPIATISQTPTELGPDWKIAEYKTPTIKDWAKVIVNEIITLPLEVAGKYIQYVQQGEKGASVTDRDIGDRYVKWLQEKGEKGRTEMERSIVNKELFPGYGIYDLAGLAENLSYSVVSMGAGVSVGLGAGAVTKSPLLGWAAGTAASGYVAYNITTYEIMQEVLEAKNEEMVQKRGSGLTKEEEETYKKEFHGSAVKYGLYEAIPEAISNFAFAKILTVPLTKVIGKSIAARVTTKLAGMYGEEIATETITQMGQMGIREDLGLPGGETRSWWEAEDWLKSLKEVAPQTFVITSIMGGAGGVAVNIDTALKSLEKEIGRTHTLYDQLKTQIKETLTEAKKRPEAGFVKLPEKGEPGVPAEIPKKEVKPIPTELEPLAKEARKYKSAEEFESAIYGGKISPENLRKMGFKITEGTRLMPGAIIEMPIDSLADFYNQAVKTKPEVKPKSAESIITQEAKALKEIEESLGITTMPKPGYEGEQFIRVSGHTQLYKDFWKENKRTPTIADWREIARKELEAGRSAIGLTEEYQRSIKGVVEVKEMDVEEIFGKIEEDERMKKLIETSFITEQERKEFLKALSTEIKEGIQKAVIENKLLTPAQIIRLEKEVRTIIKEARVPGIPTKKAIREVTAQIKPGLPEFTRRIRDWVRGLREGRITTKQEIKATQTEIVNLIDRSGLELKDKAKFRATIKNIQTVEQLQKALPEIQERIEELLGATIKRDLTETIDKELKYTKPIKKGERRVGKYDYESNKLFIKLRDYNNLNQEATLSRLNEMPTEGLSETEKIMARFLSYKTNGAKSSLILHEQVLSDIREMKRIGEETKDEADFNKKIEKQEKIEKILDSIDKQKESIRFLKGAKSVYVSSVANLYSTINAIAGKEMADKYDYAMYQTNSKSDFGNKVEVAANKTKEIYKIKSNRELNKIFLDELAPTDFTITDEEGLSQEINKFDLMNIYNGLKNDQIKERYYKHFGEEQITSLLQNIGPEEIKLADYMMGEIQEYREVLNQRSIEISGRDLGMVENYWPAKSEYQAEFFDDIKIQGEIPSAMKKRSRNSGIVPEMANAWLIFQRHIAQAEHVKTLSRRYEELKNLFSDRRIKNKIKSKYGDKTYYALMNHIETLSLNKRTDILDAFSGVYNTALNNWVKAKVASPTVFARQLISSIYSVEKVGINNFLKYQKEAIKHPRMTFRFMWDNVPFIRARFKRGYSEALQDVIKGTQKLKVGMDSITKYTTLMSRGGDVTAIIINGYPIIKTEMAKHGNMQKAIEEFQKFTEKTQQSGTLVTLSSLQRQRNAFARTFFRFKNTLNQLLRLQVDANIQFINKQISAKEFATKTFLYSIYTPTMYTLIGFLIIEGYKWIFDEEDEEKAKSLLGDILQQIIIQPFQAIPLLDATTETAYSEIRKRITGKTYYYGEGLFSYPLLDDIATAWSKLSKKEPTMEDFLRVFSLIQEPVTGIPTETLLRYIRYAVGEAKGKGVAPSKTKGGIFPEFKTFAPSKEKSSGFPEFKKF